MRRFNPVLLFAAAVAIVAILTVLQMQFPTAHDGDDYYSDTVSSAGGK